MYASIVLSSYISSSISGATLTLPASGSFIRHRINNWPGRKVRSLIDHFSSRYSAIPAPESPVSETEPLGIFQAL